VAKSALRNRETRDAESGSGSSSRRPEAPPSPSKRPEIYRQFGDATRLPPDYSASPDAFRRIRTRSSTSTAPSCHAPSPTGATSYFARSVAVRAWTPAAKRAAIPACSSVSRYSTSADSASFTYLGAKRDVLSGGGARESHGQDVADRGERYRVLRAFLHEREGEWLERIASAFLHLAGVPIELLRDSTRWLVSKHDRAAQTVTFHSAYLAFCLDWDVQPRACQPYRARTKGQDGSGVKYLKRNAIAAGV
jgi:hypothetical protein